MGAWLTNLAIAFGLAAGFFWPSGEPMATFGLLIAHLALCAHLFRARWRKTSVHAVPDPLTIYLLIETLTRIDDLMGLALTTHFPDSILAERMVTSMSPVSLEYVWKGQLLFILTTLIMLGVWRVLFEGKVFSIEGEERAKEFFFLFAVAGIAFGALKLLNVDVGYFATALKGICLGALYVISAGRSEYSARGSRFVITVLAALPLFIIGLGSGMRSEVLTVLLPLLVPYFRTAGSVKAVASVLALVFGTMFLTTYVHEWRVANWRTYGNSEEVGMVEVYGRAYGAVEQEGLVNSSLETMGQLIGRLSSLAPAGLVVQFAETDGYVGAEPLQNAAYIFIPRILWPEKPSYIPGGWFYWYMGMADTPERATTAVATYLPAEWYFMFGIWGTLFGVTLVAFVVGLSYKLLLRCRGLSILATSALWPFALLVGGISSMHSIYALSGPLIFAVYCFAIFFVFTKILPVANLAPGTGALSRSA